MGVAATWWFAWRSALVRYSLTTLLFSLTSATRFGSPPRAAARCLATPAGGCDGISAPLLQPGFGDDDLSVYRARPPPHHARTLTWRGGFPPVMAIPCGRFENSAVAA